MSERSSAEPGHPRAIGRYLLYRKIASGGMAAVHIGRLLGPVGFARTVAIKRLHEQFERDPEFVAMFLDEARIAARIRHPNVVQTLDVVATEGELFLAMDYVEGETLARLLRAAQKAGNPPPISVVLSIVCGALQGLHAAHEARSEGGQPLGVVHRDVSPENIMVGIDGTARVLDFGIAKAIGSLHVTRAGQLKGKLTYMAPEQLRNGNITRRTDVYGASVVLWEALTGSRLFAGDEATVLGQVLNGEIRAPSDVEPNVPKELDPIVLRGASRRAEDRFATALEMAKAISAVAEVASSIEVAEWVGETAGTRIAERAKLVAAVESEGSTPRPEPREASDEPATVVLPRSETPPTPARLTLSKRAWVLSIALAALVVLVPIAVWKARAPTQPTPSAPEPIVPSATPSAELTPTVAAGPPASVTSSAASPVAVERRVAPKHTPVSKKSAAPGCDPPYYISKDGVKTFRPGCPLR